MSGITLTGSMRSNLLSLQSTSSLMDTTQTRLSTGRKVNSAIDNAQSYFSAQQGYDKATALSDLKDDMGEALQKVKTAVTAVSSAISVLKQMKSLANQAKTTSDTDTKADLMNQFNDLKGQLDDITGNDANYKGTNLLSDSSNDLEITFNETATSKYTISATDVTTGNYAVADGASWSTDAAEIQTSIDDVTSAITAFQSLSKTLAAGSSFVQTRVDFTNEVSNIFKTGADNLVNADMNEESANMLTLQTRNSLGTSALSISNQASQAVLKLF
jgi:flagellin-like hook-associated protein FlgL